MRLNTEQISFDFGNLKLFAEACDLNYMLVNRLSKKMPARCKKANVAEAIMLLDELGYIIHDAKVEDTK